MSITKKLIVILGPTASGKSDLAVQIAKRFNGEIISADSRQVYKGMDIGTGKITPDTKNSSNFSTGQVKKKYIFTHKGIQHYCLDVVSPKTRFSVAQYRKLALKEIEKIQKNGKIPILCGGTGFYIQAVVDGIEIPEVKPDWKLRKKLEKKSVDDLYKILKKLDPKRAENIDRKNSRRLIRAIEIVIKTGKPIPPLQINPLPLLRASLPADRQGFGEQAFPVLMIGIKKPQNEINKLIKKRLLKRLKKGMIAEIKNLHKNGISWKKLEEFGLEYRWIAKFLQNVISKQEMIDSLQKDSEHYSKRQMTWFKKDKRIQWIKNYKQAEKLVEKFVK